MNPERVRWTDSRLDDRFETVTSELRVLRDVPTKLGEFKEQLRQLRRDVDACAESVKEHRDDFSAYVEEQTRTHEAHRIERKSDRRWMIGTVLTSAALVIAAMGLLLGHLG
jgi:DNA-binding ferritin-like protein